MNLACALARRAALAFAVVIVALCRGAFLPLRGGVVPWHSRQCWSASLCLSLYPRNGGGENRPHGQVNWLFSLLGSWSSMSSPVVLALGLVSVAPLRGRPKTPRVLPVLLRFDPLLAWVPFALRRELRRCCKFKAERASLLLRGLRRCCKPKAERAPLLATERWSSLLFPFWPVVLCAPPLAREVVCRRPKADMAAE